MLPAKSLCKLVGVLLATPVLWLLSVWPPPVWYRTHWPAETAFMRMRAAERRPPGPADSRQRSTHRPTPATPIRRYHPVPLDSIAPAVAEAAIIGEDNNFYSHDGIDYLALAQAIGYKRQTFSWASARDRAELRTLLPSVWAKRDRLRGASTITQQLAKNLYLSPSRNPLRKVKEAVTAWRLERALDKRRIMELYLNIVELGDGVWGVEAASEKYFNRHAVQLTDEEAAALAGALPFPLSSNPDYRPGRMHWRQNLILRRLHGEQVEVPKEPAADELEPVAPPYDSTTTEPEPSTLAPAALDGTPSDTALTPDSAATPADSGN